jgi:lipid-binding SYLF domain-containing protein
MRFSLATAYAGRCSTTNICRKIIMKKPRSLYTAVGVAVAALLLSAVSFGATKDQIDTRVQNTLTQFYQLNPANQDLVARAKGILVFSGVTKAGAGVAGEFGEGALQVKGQNVGYYSLSSASVGVTLGVAKHDEIIMFMTQEALDKFTSTKGWAVGADTGIAVMSKGAGGVYDTKTLQRPILGFVFAEKGLIADVSLDGSKITQLNK